MADTIRAVVIDPIKRTIEEVGLPTEPGNPTRGNGTQVRAGAFERLIGCEYLEGTYLGKGIALTLNGKPAPESGPCDFWQYGSDCEPIPGIGVISGHDIMRDHHFDCPISIEEARSKIKFSKRIIRGVEVSELKDKDGKLIGIRTERVAPIVEEGSGGITPGLPGGPSLR